MKKAISNLLLLVSIVTMYTAKAQNPLWTLPGNYWKSGTYQSIPNYSTNFVGGASTNPLEFSFDNYADFAHASMSDAQGNPLFYVIDGAVVDKNGNIIDQLRYHRKGSEVNLGLPNSCKVYGEDLKIKGYSEVLILPDPTSCFRYYIFSAGSIGNKITGTVDHDGTYGYMNGWYSSSTSNPSTMDFANASAFYPFYSVLDVSQPNTNNPAIQGNLYQVTSPDYIEQFYPSAPYYHCASPGNSYRNAFPLSDYMYTAGVTASRQLGVHYAASDLITDVNGNYRWVFISDGYKIFKLKFTGGATPFTFVSSFSLPSSINTGNSYSYEVRAEMELIKKSNGNYMIAVPYSRSSSYAVYVAELNSSADITSPISSFTKTYNYSFSDNPIIHGLEFSSDGANLYIAHEKTTAAPNPLEKIVCATQVTSAVATSCGTCVNDFQKSQIEITTANDLVFATSNRLASLNTSSGTFTNTAQTVTYAETGTVNCFTANNLAYTYLLPDQVDGMNYGAFQNQSAECCYFYNPFTIKVPVTLPTGTYTVTNGSVINCTNTTTGAPVSVTFSTISTTNSNITIPNGAKVTFQGLTIKFKPNTGMIVNAATSGQGGKVVLNASTLTWYTDCGESQLWNGVTLNGNNAAQGSTSSSPHAVLTTVGVSQIDHALVALNIKGGAIVQYTGGSKLLDNKIAIEAEAYTYVAANDVGVFNNAIIKTQSTFSIVQPTYFARITGRVPTFRFQSCTFDNDQTSYNNLYDGVVSVDSKVSLSTGCTMNDLRYGVHHTNASSNSGLKLTVNSATFNRNITGVYIGNSNYGSVNSNNFNLLDNSGTVAYAVGLYIDNSSKFVITNNIFKNQTLSLATLNGGGTIGIVANNTNKQDNNINIIKQNTFYNLHEGIQCLNKNFYINGGNPINDRGLRLYCNNFSQTIPWTDIGVHAPAGADPSAIDYHQGQVPDSAAGNSFSHYTTNDYFHYATTTYAVDYKWHTGTTNGAPNIPGGTYPVSLDDLVSNVNCGSGGEGQRIGDFSDPMAMLQTINELKNGIENASGISNRNDGEDSTNTTNDAISGMQAQLDELETKLVIYYLNDSINPAANDSAYKYMIKFSGDAVKKGLLIDAYLASGSYKNAASVYDEMANTEASTNYYIAYGILLELYGKNVAEELLTNTAMLSKVLALANDRSDETAYLIAQNLLAQINSRTHVEEVQGFNTGNVERNSLSKEGEFSVFKLSNFPNPFTGNTTLTAFVPKGSVNASIVITDVLGKVVANFNLTEGNNSVQFDKQEVKGILYYSLFIDGARKETKMMMKQ